MSIACYRSTLQQECPPSIPAEEPLTGDETLDDFVHKIRLREKSKAKRDQLPELAPSTEVDDTPSAFWQHVGRAVAWLRTDVTGSHANQFELFRAQRQ